MLVERLQGVAASFDRCRAVRYQQGLARELAHSRGTQAFLQVGRGTTFCTHACLCSDYHTNSGRMTMHVPVTPCLHRALTHVSVTG